MLEPSNLQALTDEELSALRAAGAWYASYHARPIAGEATAQTVYAIEARERYLALISALAKLGVRIPLPDELRAAQLEAA